MRKEDHGNPELIYIELVCAWDVRNSKYENLEATRRENQGNPRHSSLVLPSDKSDTNHGGKTKKEKKIALPEEGESRQPGNPLRCSCASRLWIRPAALGSL